MQSGIGCVYSSAYATLGLLLKMLLCCYITSLHILSCWRVESSPALPVCWQIRPSYVSWLSPCLAGQCLYLVCVQHHYSAVLDYHGPSVRWRHSVHLHHSSTPPSCHSDNSTATGSQGEKLSLITPWGRLGPDKATSSSLVILSPPQYRSFQEDIPNCYSFVGFKDTFYMCSCRHTTTLHITMCRKSIQILYYIDRIQEHNV